MRQKDEMAIWAKKVTEGIDDSAIFMQLYKPLKSPDEALEDPQYLLQLGYAIMLDKPIVLVASHKQTVPEKLRNVADVIGRYEENNMDSIEEAVQGAIGKIDPEKQ